MATFKILVLPGDGIGPEIMTQVMRVIEWFGERRGITFDICEDLIGGCAYDRYGKPISDAAVELAHSCDAIFVGAVGGTKYDELPFHLKPEQGLLRLRKDLVLFANLRPAVCFDALIDASTLKPDVISGLDLMIVRELTSGLYFGEPRGIFDHESGHIGINTQSYTTEEISRVARAAFDLARQRNSKLCSMEKANVMESGKLWRDVVQRIGDAEYPDVALTHMYADNGGMQLVRNPKQFDVIVTDNMFGDVLSDVAAMLTGSLGMLPSASLGAKDKDGKVPALYEPVHGSAPDIAGQGKANPIAGILSFAMALRHSFNRPDDCILLENAINAVLENGIRTADLLQADGKSAATTTQMGDAILASLDAISETS
ncbi:3-isopropylmalate dehydrogenase [Pseudorhodobacter turbinis]|uniref:3-isopropylmalate dehydrogenase n=1 Tax=Pseudorhodobacter turbinis TaxID=2500533 RepID=A0A4P8ECB9_9RHOB|nr:3-isopropylmalate dehydrogenase [Pseudorhodobacter turbinis]QCO54416.1 3-isopropylmalate dehydrogenase [Pseudorhodobacter turbinis]